MTLRYVCLARGCAREVALAADRAIPARDPSMDDLRATLAEIECRLRSSTELFAQTVKHTSDDPMLAQLADTVLVDMRLARRLRDRIVNEACS